MKNAYRFKQWNTKITGKDLMLIHLENVFINDKDIFSLVFLDYKTKKKYKVLFEEGVVAYRSMDEGCHAYMWEEMHQNKLDNNKIKNTFILLDSQWKRECPWCFENSTHYVMTTDDDIIEVLSSYPPKIEEII